MPLITGAAIAFILNVPMKFFENKLLKFMDKKPALKKFKRTLAFVLVIILVMLLIYFIMVQLVPELAKTIELILSALPKALEALVDLLEQNEIDISNFINTNMKPLTAAELQQRALSIGDMILKGLIASGSILGVVYNSILSFFFMVMFAVYILFGKEKLCVQAKKLLYSTVKVSTADEISRIFKISYKTYYSFVIGQVTEAVILGVIFFIVMSIIGMQYALLISIIIGVTALIPMIGAWIGCILGAILMLTISPAEAFKFVLMFLIVQQIEGNLIYPRVVGNAIGLSSLWVLFAIVVGQALFGVIGMLFFIPLVSVLYRIIGEYTQKRLEEKAIPKEKYL
ncbi:MAG: AI-2E family transporter [Christensenellaceae bacterium]|nr:AI-2E family transporter [Christensenellaceae bacterium]